MHAPIENNSLALSVPAVRDLAWACFTPPLIYSSHLPCTESIGNCALTLTPTRRDWLLKLDREPNALLAHLSRRHSTRLGLYFESLWQFFLQQDSAVELLAHNLPVRDGNQTVGEFDCIYYCHQRERPVHLELAVKFYLHCSGASVAAEKPGAWLGPNAHDRLDLKLARLLEHQIQLSRHPSGVAALAALGVSEPLLEVELKGRLYRHIDTTPLSPPGFNDSNRLHEWSRIDTLPAMAAKTDARYRPLQREQWLAPIAAAEEGLLGRDELCASYTAQSLARPTQFAVTNLAGVEQKRLFLVPEGWPGLPRPG